MVSRRLRREFGPRLDLSPEEAEELEEEAEEEDTSIDDLTSQADPQEFDRTFTDADAQLAIEGVFDPVAGRKQVLPRVAYTINYNFVWNPDRGRWEPDEGNEGGGVAVIATGTHTLNAENGFDSAATSISPGVGARPILSGEVTAGEGNIEAVREFWPMGITAEISSSVRYDPDGAGWEAYSEAQDGSTFGGDIEISWTAYDLAG